MTTNTTTNQTRKFSINGRKVELPLYKKGDRVKPTEQVSIAVGAMGTVESVTSDGLFVNVSWDKTYYPSIFDANGKIEIGRACMVDGLELVSTESLETN